MTISSEEGPREAANEPLEGLGTRIARRFAGVGLTEPLPEVHAEVSPGSTPGELSAGLEG